MFFLKFLQKKLLSYNFYMNDFFLNLKNTIDFQLRKWLKLSRINYFEPNEIKNDLFLTQNCVCDKKRLDETYDLTYLKTHTTKQNYLENLYTLEILDKYLDIEFKDELKVLDVGSKNWFYAKGEYFFFNKYCDNLMLNGIEIDANRVYSNFYSRAEVAKFHIKDLMGLNFIVGDFLKHNEKYDYVVWILPFVIKEPLLKWGLPSDCFKPEEMLLHAYKSLKNNGKILIINQGENEYEAQKALCEKLELTYIPLGEIRSNFLNYKPRYGILISN